MIHSYTQAFAHRITCRANAWAAVRGGTKYPRLLGSVKLYQTQAGVLVLSEFHNLPYSPGGTGNSVFGFHIHSGKSCGEQNGMEFGEADGHFNPENTLHPEHAGDLPPLIANCGYAWSVFLTNRFTIREVLGHPIIVHEKPDDFTTQPSGNSGAMIACGIIR